eukprot:549134-Prymnesium_polylepis.2
MKLNQPAREANPRLSRCRAPSTVPTSVQVLGSRDARQQMPLRAPRQQKPLRALVSSTVPTARSRGFDRGRPRALSVIDVANRERRAIDRDEALGDNIRQQPRRRLDLRATRRPQRLLGALWGCELGGGRAARANASLCAAAPPHRRAAGVALARPTRACAVNARGGGASGGGRPRWPWWRRAP